MKKFVRVLLVFAGILTVVIAFVLIFVKTYLPNVGDAPDLQVEITSERLINGDYLANHVMVCIDCHSLRDWEIFSAPPIAGTEGGGGERFGRDFGFPGEFYSPNITPFGVGHWTDGELFRVITTGVTKDGTAIFPIMPYLEYGKLDPSDIMDVIAYTRNLPSIANELPEREIDFPMNFIINTIPSKAEPQSRPAITERLEYGKYIFTAAACQDCHTKAEKGKITGEYLAGGFEFNLPDGSVLRSTNITPHPTGIGLMNEQFFINRFKAYTDNTIEPQRVAIGDFITVMPWMMYGGMTDEDLGAIYHYLNSVPPKDNLVERFSFAAQ